MPGYPVSLCCVSVVGPLHLQDHAGILKPTTIYNKHGDLTLYSFPLPEHIMDLKLLETRFVLYLIYLPTQVILHLFLLKIARRN